MKPNPSVADLKESHIPHHRHIHRPATLATLMALTCSFKTIFAHDLFRLLVILPAFDTIILTYLTVETVEAGRG